MQICGTQQHDGKRIRPVGSASWTTSIDSSFNSFMDTSLEQLTAFVNETSKLAAVQRKLAEDSYNTAVANWNFRKETHNVIS